MTDDQVRAKRIVSAAVDLAPYPAWMKAGALQTALAHLDQDAAMAELFMDRVRDIVGAKP